MTFIVDPEMEIGLRDYVTEDQGPDTIARRREEARATHLPRAPLAGVSVEELWITPDGPRALLYRPEGARGPLPGVMHSHGGGYMFGLPEQSHRRNGALALELGVAALSVDYRKAPEHPYPAALNDMIAAWHWMQGQGDRFIPGRIALLGESAGGGLAAALALALRDAGGVQPVFQCLIYPMIDDRTGSPANPWTGPRHHVWTAASNVAGWTAYLGHAPGGEGVSYLAAPARAANLSDLPPAWIGSGDIDLFVAEDVDFAMRLIARQIPCEIRVIPGAYHAFQRQAPEAMQTRLFESGYFAALVRAVSS
jgi:acetyl esterase/lipase